MTITHTPLEALEILVRDLNETTWSSWQSTSKFSTALDIAEQVLKREKARESAHDLLFDLEAACDEIEGLVSRLGGTDPEKATKQYRATIAKATGGAA